MLRAGLLNLGTLKNFFLHASTHCLAHSWCLAAPILPACKRALPREQTDFGIAEAGRPCVRCSTCEICSRLRMIGQEFSRLHLSLHLSLACHSAAGSALPDQYTSLGTVIHALSLCWPLHTPHTALPLPGHPLYLQHKQLSAASSAPGPESGQAAICADA